MSKDLKRNEKSYEPWGIWCVETVWDSHKDGRSARPMLEVLEAGSSAPFVHRTAVTRDEFFRHLDNWWENSLEYPILYLGYHGESGEIWLDGDKNTPHRNQVLLNGISGHLERSGMSCKNTLIHFGSCSTLDLPDIAIEFLNKTQAAAVSGYSIPVDWTGALAFEMLYLEMILYVQKQKPTRLIQSRMNELALMMNDPPYSVLEEELGFKLHIA